VGEEIVGVAATLARRRFTAAEYERMAEAGILGEDDRVELIAGEIVEVSPVGGRHVGSLGRANRLVSRQAGDHLLVSVQSPIQLSATSEPEPDLAVVRDRAYGRALPAPADVLLVIEVADTSRDYDRGVKLPLYAAAGIPEAWLFDLVTETIERHTEPHGGRYGLVAIVGRGQALSSTVLPGLTIAADVIFG
jgi:Uma2 family endonuclease